VLAGVVALSMTAWDAGWDPRTATRNAKAEIRKDQVRDRNAQAPKGR